MGQGVQSLYLEAAYGETHAALTKNLLVMAVVALLVLAAAWWGSRALMLRPIVALVDTSAKLGKGDLSARTGIGLREDEIGQLAGAFDHMADAIQHRESKRKSAEQTRAQLAAIVESSSDAIVSHKGAEYLFGYSAKEMIGQSIMRIVPQGATALAEHNFERIKRGERIDSYETTRFKKGDLPIDVSVTISPIIDDSDAAIGASSITRDISARKRAENALRALHDINLARTPWESGRAAYSSDHRGFA